jgi:hypothetical protein
LLQLAEQFDTNAEAFDAATDSFDDPPRICDGSASTQMRRLSCVNIQAKCASDAAERTLPILSPMTKMINYAVQRQSPSFDHWDTMRTSITPHEARARRLMRWQQSLRTRFQFRLVKLETQTTIIPIEQE